MQTVSPEAIAHEAAIAQTARVLQVTYEDLHDAWLADASPNKGTEEDYVERKLATGWRRSADGKGIWCIPSPIVGNVPENNTPDPSLFKDPGPPTNDANGSPAEQQAYAAEHDDLRAPELRAKAEPVEPEVAPKKSAFGKAK